MMLFCAKQKPTENRRNNELCFKTARVKLEGASTIFQNEFSLNVSIQPEKLSD
jgi:hypothetical protein